MLFSRTKMPDVSQAFKVMFKLDNIIIDTQRPTSNRKHTSPSTDILCGRPSMASGPCSHRRTATQFHGTGATYVFSSKLDVVYL